MIKRFMTLIYMLKFFVYVMSAIFLFLQLKAQDFPKGQKTIDLTKFIDTKVAMCAIFIALLLAIESFVKSVEENTIKP